MDLVSRAKGRELRALGRLFDRYYARVCTVVRLRQGIKSHDVLGSRKVLKEVFARALETMDQFELRNRPSVIDWLSHIAERVAKEAADKLPGPGNRVASPGEAGIVEKCISELPEEYREIIVLRDYIEYGWEDVAREYKRLSIDAARMMHAKAMVELERRIRKRNRP